MKILDFVPNEEILECVFITLDKVTLRYGDGGDYRASEDSKWKQFCEKYKLRGQDKHITSKWYEMYLTLCKEGIL